MVFAIIGNIIGRIFGNDIPSCTLNDDVVSPCFKPGLMLDIGITWIMYLRRFLVSAVAVGTKEGVQSTKCDQICRASELPIYIGEECKGKKSELCPPEPGFMENTFGGLRRQVMSVFDEFKVYQSQAEDAIQDSTSKAYSWLQYLSVEADESTRIGAIGVGALAGYIFGMRGGHFKRFFYSNVAAGSMTALCYPKQTAEFSQKAIASAQKYATIGYNFIFGVKPGDSLPELPKLPRSFGDVWDMASNLGKSAASLVTERAPEPPFEADKAAKKN